MPKILEQLKSAFQRLKSGNNTGVRKKHPWLVGITGLVVFVMMYVLSSLGGLRVFLPYFGEITGFPFGSRNYLVVFQNNNELRPAGGFVSSYGIVKFRYGFLAGLDIQDVYGDVDNHSYQEPPYPMKQLLADRWYQGYTFRDANYNPDYPKTATELVRMLQLTKPDLKIDGVIAVNYSFLEDLLVAVGPMDVDGKLFTKNSLFGMLEHEVNNVDRHNVEDLQNRKGILKDFAQRLMKKIALSPLKLRKVSDTIAHSLATKEIQMYFMNPSLQKMVTDNSWSGAWPETLRGDFLAVVEANLGGMKSDRYIQRRVQYHLKLVDNDETAGKDLIAEVTIDVDHYGVEDVPMNGEYTGFFRTFVPRGAKLLEAKSENQKSLWQKDDGLYTVFGNVVRLSPGEKTRLYYRYKLPASVLHGNEYELNIPKQSGTDQDYYSVTFEAPQGSTIESPHFTPHENVATYQQELQSDLSLYLKIQPDRLPPNVIYQAIEELNKITIVFNENVSNEAAEDPLNYELKDLNKKHPESTDYLQIDRIEHQGKAIILHTRNMTQQYEEHYTVTMKNIADTHGNPLNPNPKTITVVQRLGR
ncbi:MAG: DUF4012 domain-containing protein [Candidatus Gracilibacteria bacterium]